MKTRSSIVMLTYSYYPIDTRIKREARFLSKFETRIAILNISDPNSSLPRNYHSIDENILDQPIMYVAPEKRASIRNLLMFWILSFIRLMNLEMRIDVIHCHDLSALPPGVLYKILHPSARLVYDSHELFPEAALDKLNSFFWAGFLILEILCSHFVDVIIGASELQIKIMKNRLKNDRFYLLLNVPDLDDIDLNIFNLAETRFTRQKKSQNSRIVYSGRVMTYRGYDQFIEAASYLLNDSKEFEFWIVGGGPYLKRIKQLVRNKKIGKNVIFTGQVSYPDMFQILAESDIGICLYENLTINNNVMISNKIFEYMMVGLPFIFSNLVSSKPLVKSVNAVLVDPYKPHEIAQSILALIKNPDRMKEISRKSIELTKKRYNWKLEAKVLLKVYKNL